MHYRQITFTALCTCAQVGLIKHLLVCAIKLEVGDNLIQMLFNIWIRLFVCSFYSFQNHTWFLILMCRSVDGTQSLLVASFPGLHHLQSLITVVCKYGGGRIWSCVVTSGRKIHREQCLTKDLEALSVMPAVKGKHPQCCSLFSGMRQVLQKPTDMNHQRKYAVDREGRY